MRSNNNHILSKMDPLKKKYYNSGKFMSLNIKALQIVGLWPKIHVPKKFEWLIQIYRFYGRLFLFIVMVNIVTQIADVVLTWGDIENLAANGSVTFIYIAAFLKQLLFFVNQKRFTVLVENIQNGHFSCSLNWDADRNKIANDGNKRALIISWLFYVITFGTTTSMIIIALINSYPEVSGLEAVLHGNQTMKTLPLKASFPFDVQKPEYFAATFLFQISMLTLAPLMNSGIDTFTTSLIIHCCVQFKILKHALRNIDKRANKFIPGENINLSETEVGEENDLRGYINAEGTSCRIFVDRREEKSQYFQSKGNINYDDCLIECIKHHQNLLEFVTEMERGLTVMMFGQFICSTSVICLILFYLALSLDNQKIDDSIKFVQLLVTATVQIFLYCWFGNELTYQSDSVTKAMYDSPWYEASMQYKKNLCIMMARTMKLSHLTGAKLYVLSLETFRALMGASFSYYTVLSNIKNMD